MNLSAVDPALALFKAFDEVARPWVLAIHEGSPVKDQVDDKIVLMAQLAVTYGNGAFDFMAGFDVLWHTEMFKGVTEYDPAGQEMIVKAYRDWLAGARSLVGALDRLEAQGRSIQGADDLRTNIRKAESVLTADDEFFEGEELDRLTEEALAANDRGEAVEFTKMGQ